jgi:hypothetical protein
MKYYIKTGITEFGISGVGIRDAGTSEFSNEYEILYENWDN